MRVATFTVEGSAPLTQSQYHATPKNMGESPDAFDERTWRAKAYTIDGRVHLKAAALFNCLIDGAKHAQERIPGKGQATWGKKFEAGIMVAADIDLGTPIEQVEPITLFVNADGVRGSGKRVIKRFPQLPTGWRGQAKVYILDPAITPEVFDRMARRAGSFVGVGQNRPQNRGSCGRFKVISIDWQEE